MNWDEPEAKLKTLTESIISWWENEAKNHLCIRQGSTPNHVSLAYAIRNFQDKQIDSATEKKE